MFKKLLMTVVVAGYLVNVMPQGILVSAEAGGTITRMNGNESAQEAEFDEEVDEELAAYIEEVQFISGTVESEASTDTLDELEGHVDELTNGMITHAVVVLITGSVIAFKFYRTYQRHKRSE